MQPEFYAELRQGAEVHRQVRKYAQKIIKPGMGLTEIAESIEDGTRHLTGHMGLEEGDNLLGGVAFPTGLSRNNCAAHYSPNAGNKMTVDKDDVLKVDFGVHLNGRIIDSAFTMSWNPIYDNLLAAVKDATNTGIRVCLLATTETISRTDKHRRKQELTCASVTLVRPSKKLWSPTKSS